MLLNTALPLALAIIMFALGLGLTFADFRRVAAMPVPFIAGSVAQIILLPLAAYAIIMAFGLGGALAVGVMILALCPGGVTSNMLTKLGHGDVALSVSLTGIVSLLSIFTVPLLTAWSVRHFMGEAGPAINISTLALAMFLITAVPVIAGLLIRQYLPGLSQRIEPVMSRLATILFLVIVVAALATNWDIFIENLPVLGPALIALNLFMLGAGNLIGFMAGASRGEATAIAIETGIQNASMGITIGSIVAATASGIGPLSLPSGVYGITMYLVTIPYVLWRRSRADHL